MEKMVSNKNSSQCFLDCNKRYRKSREVEEILQEIKKLLEAGCFNSGMVYPIRFPRVVEHIPGPSIQGGIGKTTLVKNLNNELKTTSMQPFGIVIWATVFENLDIKNVQTQITHRLNMESEDHKGCKILLTSRRMKVCRNIMTDFETKMDVLNDEEAWQLFSQNVGDVTHSEEIRPFAEAIVRECCRLPLAIITVGAAMRKKTKVELWKHVLNELRRSVPSIEGMEADVYKQLKSYHSLQDNNIKSCFLYCFLFPEYFSIQISELVQYWLVEGLIDGPNYEDSIEGIALIEKLKDSCLWEDGAHERTVKMHDTVCDVARWIASSSKDGCKSLVRSGILLSEISFGEFSNSNSLKRVSLVNNEITWLPDCIIQCLEASTLLLQRNYLLDTILERFLQGFKALSVLNLRLRLNWA
nr:disease resistance protein [Quercus suber]